MVYHERALHNYVIPCTENTVGNIINATYARRTVVRLDVIPGNIQWLSCILIGCIFHGMVKISRSVVFLMTKCSFNW